MPKIVDHDARRADIVAALWRVIGRDGVGAASVRTVAAEAGLSPGALRHYFDTQDELLASAVTSMMDGVESRVRERLAGWAADPGPLGSAQRTARLAAVLDEVAPLDGRRRAEFEVWLELVMLARTSPSLRRLSLDAHRGLRTLCATLVLALSAGDDPPRGQAAVERDPLLRARTDELHALLDGLSLHLALYPRETSTARVRAVLGARLAAYAAAPG